KVQEIIYPKPQIEEDFPVYRGDVKVKIKTKLIDEKSAFQGAINVKWQGCQDFGDKVCFMPTTTKVPFDLKIQAAKKEESKEQNETDAISSNVNSSAVGEKTSKFSIFNSFSEKGRFVGFKSSKDFKNWYEGSKAGEEKEKENLFSKVAKENLFLAIVVAFFFGFLSSLTPCVYPIIPITIAYIGSKSQGKGKLSGFLLSLFFVVGLAVVYSSFGVASSLLGVSFGSLTQKPIVGISIAIIFALLGFSMLGLFEIAMPSKFASKIEEGKKKGKGYLGAFLIGALSGLVASPCIGPLLLAILVIVASLGSAVLGFLYLFSFALGMGVLFIIIGTFSGILSSLPKSGSWMDFVKILFGALIFGGSFYFASLYMSPKYFFLYCGLLIGFLISFLFFGANRHFFPVAFRIAGSILIVLCFVIVLILTPVKENDISQEYLFEKDLFEAANKSLKENKPLLIDFRADWCVACVELEKKTWPSDEAKEVFAEIVPAKVDFTVETAETKELTKIFKINGLPTVVLLYPQKADSSNED
ncbi:MAG: sulfite exporter TauE/SafE family protein, partial [Acidobacteria bacterium]|nr:sulfite exporter TauE/SafE family protein [Acidobacteriota bacterium]